MSYKSSQLLPPMVTRRTAREVFVHVPSHERSEDSWEAQSWRSWLKRDAKLQLSRSRVMNWATILGLALTVIVGATFWTAVGFFVARLWK